MSKKYSSTCPFAKNEYLPAGAGCFQVDAYCGRTGEKRGKIDPQLCEGCIVEKNRRKNELLKKKLDNTSDNKLIKRFPSLDLPKLYGQTKGKLLDVQILDFKKGISPQLIGYLQKQDEFYKDETCICLVFIGNKAIPFLDVSKLYKKDGSSKYDYYFPLIGKIFSFEEYKKTDN